MPYYHTWSLTHIHARIACPHHLTALRKQSALANTTDELSYRDFLGALRETHALLTVVDAAFIQMLSANV